MTADTRPVRINTDLAEMLAAIQRHGKKPASEILDPIVRKSIERLFSQLPTIDQQYTRERIARMNAERETAAAAG